MLNLSSEIAQKFPSLKVSAWARKTMTWIDHYGEIIYKPTESTCIEATLYRNDR